MSEKEIVAPAEGSVEASGASEAVASTSPSPASPSTAAAASTEHAPRPERSGGDRPYRGGQGGPRMRRKKVCQFCIDRQEHIDYKDTARLRKFISERAKIIPRRVTGTCAFHQRELTESIKRARQVALLPYVSD